MFIVKRIASHNGFPNKLYHSFSSNYTMPLRTLERRSAYIHCAIQLIQQNASSILSDYDSFSLFFTRSLFLFISFSLSLPLLPPSSHNLVRRLRTLLSFCLFTFLRYYSLVDTSCPLAIPTRHRHTRKEAIETTIEGELVR